MIKCLKSFIEYSKLLENVDKLPKNYPTNNKQYDKPLKYIKNDNILFNNSTWKS